MKNIFNKLSTSIVEKYITVSKRKGREAFSRQKIKELSYLNPGKDGYILARDYYINKVGKLIMIFLAGMWLIILIGISGLSRNTINKENTIKRNKYGEGSKQIRLNAKTDGFKYKDIELNISEQKPGEDEEKQMADEVYKKLCEVILGNNKSIKKVESDLNLVRKIQGYPLDIRWESSNYMLLDENGRYKETEISPNGEELLLRAIISRGKSEYTYEFSAIIFPCKQNDAEKDIYKLNNILKKIDEESNTSGEFKLPDKLNDKSITWEEKREPLIVIIGFMLFLTLIATWGGMDNDLKSKYKQREYMLLADYAEFVSKLQIFLSAGMTIRGSFERIYKEYRNSLNEKEGMRYLYEELGICVKKLQDGVREVECYELLGKRCGLSSYKKLSSLLCQNLKKGNEGLVTALQSEVRLAFEERKNIVRKQGEEARTKLMLPMMMLLGVVMIIIMVPAYLSFGGM